jgi:hypothetical protein
MRALFQSRLRHGKLFRLHGGAYSAAATTIAIMQQVFAAIDWAERGNMQERSCNAMQPECATKPVAIIDI